MTECLNSIPIETFIRTLPEAVQRQIACQTAATAYCGQVRMSLKALRQRQGKSQKQIAAAMGVRPSVVSRIETEMDVEIGLDMVFRYARALGYRPELTFKPADPEQRSG
jgi:DNA-binding XRE family transcriptional regulator